MKSFEVIEHFWWFRRCPYHLKAAIYAQNG